MIKFLIGDIFKSKAETLVNTVNCVGIMGKGVALEFKNRYPEMYKDYVKRCKSGEVKPGLPYLYYDILGVSILNFPTKEDWRSMSNIDFVINGLIWFRKYYSELNISSIAFPPLGCGNGGLLWEDVGPIMYKYLHDLPITVEVYAPFGTKSEYLSKEFLSNEKEIQSRIGKRASKFNDKWLCILEVIKRLNENTYASRTGRTGYQKICYMLDYYRLNLGFKFEQGSFGPYSVEAKQAFNQMSNANLLYEKKFGKMDAIFTTEHYLKLAKNKCYVLDTYNGVIDNVVDVFSRIKNTAQAEIFTTIIYAYKNLSMSASVTERAVLDYILKWKRRWEPQKVLIAQNIREMAMLKFIEPIKSEDLLPE